MEELIYYTKKKFIYIVRSETRNKVWGFGNIKAAVTWFGVSNLFPALVLSDYDRIVRSIRESGVYSIHHYGESWEIKAVEMVGQKVRSARRMSTIVDKSV